MLTELVVDNPPQTPISAQDRQIAERVFGDNYDLLEQTGRNLWEELLRRSEDEKEVAKLDNSHLVRLADLVARFALAIERKEKPEGPKEVTLNVYQSLQGLPRERQLQILEQTRKELAAVEATINETPQVQD